MEIDVMKKSDRQKKWKVLIVVIWILFLAAAGIGCYFVQRTSAYKKAKSKRGNSFENCEHHIP